MASRKFTALYHRHVASVFDRQLQLKDRVGAREPTYDARAARLRFLPDLSYRVQLLGRERDDVFTWAWADGGKPAPYLLKDCQGLRRHGDRYDVPELAQPTVDRAALAPRFLATVACGMARAHAWFRVAGRDDALWLLIQDPRFGASSPDPITRITKVFPQVVEKVRCNHRDAYVGYLEYHGLTPARHGDTLRTTLDDGRGLAATFDAAGRLLRLRRTESGQSTA